VRGRPVYDNSATLRFLEGLAIDVTPLKAAELEKIAFERQLQETQKLESLGVLAGGIAHDFNNLLTAMLGNATLARMNVQPSSLADDHLDHIEHAARRAADLCQQMLAYAGKKEVKARATDLSELVRSTAALLRVSLRKNTQLDLRLDASLPATLADPAQIQQIVMNLVINAAEAVGDDPGEIVVTTFQRQVDAAFLRTALRSPELPAGNYVGLEVRDTGGGMTPETLSRIFEPFFTTKFSGRGLGLAAVLGIVQSHRGALFVESKVGHGSTFRLFLQAQVGTTAATSTAVPVASHPMLHGTALVVDDEPAVRDVLAAVLRRHGMTTLLAANGHEALRRFGECENKVDLVLLDLMMPGLSGEETLRVMRSMNHAQRIVVMSGFSEPDARTRCEELGVTEFIEKPFELQTLMAKLKPAA
jgi:signal transduction histidine kinase/CheY-like chemotaxis protein